MNGAERGFWAAWLLTTVASAQVPAQAPAAGAHAASTSAAKSKAQGGALASTPSAAANSGIAPADTEAQARLASYFAALRRQRLVTGETAKVEELRAILAHAEDLSQRDRHEDAALQLFEVLLHPRFADYAELDELDAARYHLASALHELGAEASARRVLLELLRKGPSSGYFGPGYRKYVDVALMSPDQRTLVDELRGLGHALPEDAQNELRYLSGQERHAAGDEPAATSELEQVSPHSRFYANAQYLLGAMAARAERLRDAEQHLCRITGTGDDKRFSFYVDARYFQIKDLARLGLGRLAHEMRRGDDAFYYYFQVPTDSPRLPEAMFEGAYARYESKDFDTAIDLLDQLEARFPHSASADEAALLRGYVALSRCDYEHAQQHFDRFIRRFEPVAAQLERIVANPVRQQALYEELVREAEQPRTPDASVRGSLLSLLRVDPEFHALHERVRQLDAEAARAGRLGDSFDMIAARLAGSERPKPAAAEATSERDALLAIKLELKDAQLALRALTDQLDTMRKLGAKSAELPALEADVSRLAKRVHALEHAVDEARFAAMPEAAAPSDGTDAEALLLQDALQARGFERRVAELRPRLILAANGRALVELQALRERLSSFVRRARIGRIDAVMGSKRRVEKQIESLAAGRFPAELRDPLRVQGFLADDEEYWPFEGDDWPDEYLERYRTSDDADPGPGGSE